MADLLQIVICGLVRGQAACKSYLVVLLPPVSTGMVGCGVGDQWGWGPVLMTYMPITAQEDGSWLCKFELT